MIVPCMENSVLYAPPSAITEASGVKSSSRIRPANTPPIRKNRRATVMYWMPMTL